MIDDTLNYNNYLFIIIQDCKSCLNKETNNDDNKEIWKLVLRDSLRYYAKHLFFNFQI